MKKLFAAVVTFAFICVFFCLSASAATLDGDAQRSAEMLKELNLFRGTDKGFELDREMTRAEAAAMLVRFLGAEDAAMNGEFSHPFTDVPEWADNYVGWLYTSGLTKGVSSTLYGSQQPVTAWQYATFITRALQNDEVIPSELITEDEINAIDSEKKFLRGNAAILSVRALGCTYTKNENYRSLADVCIESGLFTAKKFGEVAGEFFGSDYSFDNDGYIIRRILGIEVAKSAEGGYYVYVAIDPIASDGTKYDPLVYRQDGETTTIYTMNPETLETTEISKRKGMKDNVLYSSAFKIGETLLILETHINEDKHIVLTVKNGEVQELLNFTESGWRVAPITLNILLDADSAILMTKAKYYRITEDGYTEIGSPSLLPLDYIDGDILARRINDTSIDVLQIDAKTGKEEVSYNIPDDIERGEYGDGYRDLDRRFEKYYYGEAGLYYYDNADKTLVQITSRPANDFFKTDDGGYVILTHKPGERYYGMVHPGGNEIMYIGADGSEKYLTKEDTPFSIATVFLKDGKVHFTTAAGVGMMNFDVFTYRIEDDGKLTVTDFDAGRPEVMDGFTWDDPDGYKPGYIEAEQKRIEELGY